MALPSRIDAERRYQKTRALALEATQNSIDGKFRLTQITSQALQATSLWENSSQRRFHRDWQKNYSS